MKILILIAVLFMGGCQKQNMSDSACEHSCGIRRNKFMSTGHTVDDKGWAEELRCYCKTDTGWEEAK